MSRASCSTRSLAPPVDLADEEGAFAAEEDSPGADIVGAEVDERAHRALRADGVGDEWLVDAVLQRDDESVVGQLRSDVDWSADCV